jgi:integrase
MRETWLGGFIRENDAGEPIFVIRKRVDGHQYEVSTRCRTERAALKQLERFEADPANYSPSGDDKKAVYLDEQLAKEFLVHCRDVKKNSPLWLAKQKSYVAWWAGQLAGVSLTRVSLTEHIEPALEGKKARGHRIATLKAIYSWLRKVKHALTPAQDPTFGTLSVPQSDPNARLIKDKAIPKEAYLKVREQLDGHWRAALDVQAGTGWHITEVKRFAEGGLTEAHPQKEKAKAKGIAGVLVCPETKAGGLLRTAVGKEVLAAADLLLERGSFSVEKYGLAVHEARKAANAKILEDAKLSKSKKKPELIESFTPGRMRHSVATWAINSGADPAQVSAFLNHKNPRTTRKFYATHAVATKVPTLL